MDFDTFFNDAIKIIIENTGWLASIMTIIVCCNEIFKK